MTLMNGLALGNKAMLWSDTLVMNGETKKPLGYATKLYELVMFPCAIATTFIGLPLEMLIGRIGGEFPMTLGQALDAAERALRITVEEQPHYAMGRLLLAGWCWETNTVRLFVIHSESGTDGSGNNCEPYTAQEVGYLVGHGAQEPRVQELISQGVTPEKMLEIAEVQRMIPILPDGPWGAMYGIGGHLQEATVTREGVTVRAVQNWGDDLPVERDAA